MKRDYLLVVKRENVITLAYEEKLIQAFRLARFLLKFGKQITEIEIFNFSNLKISYVIKREFIT